LIEVLVVVFLLALSSMVMIMNLPLGRGHSAEQAANGLFQRLQVLSEEAILGSHDFGLTIDQSTHQIRFVGLTGQGWTPLVSDRISATLSLAEDVVLDVQLGSSVWRRQQEPLDVIGSLFGDEEQPIREIPQFLLLSSGELTPFLVRFTASGESPAKGWTVQVQENGTIRLLAPNEALDD
jgi:general secretion pathway protein H